MRLAFVSIFLLTLASLRADRYSDYIDTYHPLAVAEMENYGIPASITLAQGLLESAAGNSTLAREGNNHFGIKCHSGWEGATMLRSDDAPDECFRVYDNPADSFRDHSLFLSRKRYSSLFDLEPTDYASWAKGLKQCGYATDPHYADRLIAIIERYNLSSYDGAGAAEGIAEFIRSQLGSSHRICRYRGLHYVVAVPGDTYQTLARELNCDAARLASFNDATADNEIRAWEEVYLQPKLTDAPQEMSRITIGEDETLRSVAQRLGMTVESLRALNPKAKDQPGTRLKLK
ncbi:MAG: LysM peptidoglycan-binding domain-containing protein [Bacteroides sp.]|nr:LysM peptidoglycan-binding domain-containing protein [Bacteroides sp.]